MSCHGPKTVPDPWEFEPRVGRSMRKHDFLLLWRVRNASSPWVRQWLRSRFAALRRDKAEAAREGVPW